MVVVEGGRLLELERAGGCGGGDRENGGLGWWLWAVGLVAMVVLRRMERGVKPKRSVGLDLWFGYES